MYLSSPKESIRGRPAEGTVSGRLRTGPSVRRPRIEFLEVVRVMPLRGPLQRARLGSLSPSSEPESPSSCVRSNLDDICAGRRDHPPPRPRFVCNRHCLTALTNRLTKMACWDPHRTPPPTRSRFPKVHALARRHRRRLARAESRHRRDRHHWTPIRGRTGLMRPPLGLVRGARHACQRAGSPVRCKGAATRRHWLVLSSATGDAAACKAADDGAGRGRRAVGSAGARTWGRLGPLLPLRVNGVVCVCTPPPTPSIAVSPGPGSGAAATKGGRIVGILVEPSPFHPNA